MTDLSNQPSIAPLTMPPLPADWSRPLSVIVPWLLLPLIFVIHAWISGHIRRHGFPPLIVMRIIPWWRP